MIAPANVVKLCSPLRTRSIGQTLWNNAIENRNPAALICAGGALDHSRLFEVQSGNYTGDFRGSELTR
jgi:hypothetical protein